MIAVRSRLGCVFVSFVVLALNRPLPVIAAAPAKQFHDKIQPLLTQYCYDCHADGMNKGNVAFDEFKTDQAVLDDRAQSRVRATAAPENANRSRR